MDEKENQNPNFIFLKVKVPRSHLSPFKSTVPGVPNRTLQTTRAHMFRLITVYCLQMSLVMASDRHPEYCTDEQMLDFSKSGDEGQRGRGRFGPSKSKLEECIDVHAKSNVNATNTDGVTALMLASVHGHTSIVKALVKAGADVHAKTNNGWTAFKLVSDIGQTNVGHQSIYEILRKASGLCSDNEVGLYSFNGDLEQVKTCISGGSNLNGKNEHGTTPLMLATVRGHSAIVGALVAAKADVYAMNNNGVTALDFATEIGHTVIAEMFQQAHQVGTISL